MTSRELTNIDIITKEFNKLENYATNYIYKKYIEMNPVSNSNTSETTDLLVDKDSNYKYSRKPNCSLEYKLYRDRIFNKDRKSIIKQDEVLKDDLTKMSLADKEWEKQTNTNTFIRKGTNSYPDIKRCSYIRKHKNKLMRCKNSILNDDEDVCKCHLITPNIYYDMYYELLEKIKHKKIKI
jgi:hypothetical protein